MLVADAAQRESRPVAIIDLTSFQWFAEGNQCDGGIPACGNCQKASEPCIDVDGRNNSLSIPRDFAANARARIEWLEQQIKLSNPDLDFREGPQVDFSFLDAVRAVGSQAVASPNVRELHQQDVVSPREPCLTLGKRTRDPAPVPLIIDGFSDEARSVALDLGLLSLNSDSRQTHYLGTSSGRLFTRLIGAGSPDAAGGLSADLPPGNPMVQKPSKFGVYAHTKRFKESCRQLYSTLRKSLPVEEDARTLLEVYFRSIHVDHPFLHPESLLSAVEALYQCAAIDGTVEIGYNGWAASVPTFAYNGSLKDLGTWIAYR